MKRRITQFDYIRVFSLFGILICHSCYCFATTEWVGRYFGLTFNFLFLALSALLFGMSWNSNGRVSYKKDFLQRRFAKLSKSYYSYLVILFLFLYLTEDYFSWKHIVTHFLYLPWFYKINGFGHLWFLSMIAICYVGIYIISHIKPRQTGNYLAISTLIGGILLDYITDQHGLPGYMFPYAIGYLMIFFYSNVIIGKISKMGMCAVISQFIIINICGLIAFKQGIFATNGLIAYFIGIACACSIFVFMFRLLERVLTSNIVVWLSGISFEIYLVHEFFLGRFNVYHIIDAPIISFILLIILSVTSAIVLSRLSKVFERRNPHIIK